MTLKKITGSLINISWDFMEQRLEVVGNLDTRFHMFTFTRRADCWKNVHVHVGEMTVWFRWAKTIIHYNNSFAVSHRIYRFNQNIV